MGKRSHQMIRPKPRISTTLPHHGKPLEFVSKIYVEKTTVEILEASKTMIEKKGNRTKIMFISMYNDIVFWKKNNKNECCDSATRVAQYAQNFKPGHWSFLGLEEEDTWYGSLINKLDAIIC